jgi:hypothetical protein
MYDTDIPQPKGPYYVPWKKTSMDAHGKYFAKKIYKNSKGYIPNSTLGNVPTEPEQDNTDK